MSPVVLHLWSAAPEGITLLGTATGAQTNLVTAHEMALPAGSTTGDVVVVFFRVGTDHFTEGGTTFPTPAGWTSLGGTTGSRTIYRQLQVGDPSTVTITTGATRRSAYTAYRWGGAFGTAQANSTGGRDSLSLTPAWGSAANAWITSVSHRGTDNTHTPPANYGDTLTAQTSSGLDDNAHCMISTAHRILAAASEDPATWTITKDNQTIAYTVAVRPA